ncbi:MAG: LuxR C-terminal-related transcriptional regulator [Thermoleophilia bacterium]
MPTPHGGEAAAPLLGRSAELGRIGTLLDAARHGRSGALLIAGDPGVGKTALLDAAVGMAGDLRVLRASGYEMEADLAFAGLSTILRPLMSGLEGLPPPQAAAVAGAIGLGPPPPPGDRFTAYAGALGLLSAAAEEGPLLVAVDDAHWLDPASLDAIAFVGRRIAGEGIVVIMAAREVPAAALRRSGGIEVMRLEGLAGAHAAELAQRVSGASLSGGVTARLVRETRGNPLALIESVRSLTADQAAGRASLPHTLPVGPAVVEALATRMAPLSPNARRALLITAAGEGDPGLVSQALHSEGVHGDLSAAEDAGVIVMSVTGPVFRHPLLRLGAYRAASAKERRAVHRKLAEIAETGGDGMLETRARHLAAAADGPDETVALALEDAAARAAGRTGYAEAAELLRRAAELSTSPDTRNSRLVQAGFLGVTAGSAELARDCLDRAIREGHDPALISRARAIRAHLEIWAGSARLAREMLVAETERLGPGAPGVVTLLVDASIASGMCGDIARALDLARRAESELNGDDPRLNTLVSIVHANCSVLAGESRASDRVSAMGDPLALLADGDPLSWARVGIALQPLSWSGRFADADALAERLIAMGRSFSAPSMLPFPLGARADFKIAAGDWDGAFTSASEALTLAEETGQLGVADFARCHLARILAGRGEETVCRAHATAALGNTPLHEATSLPVYAHAALGLLELGLGNLETAFAELQITDDLTYDRGLRAHATVPFLPDLVEVAVRLGRNTDAERALSRLEEQEDTSFPRALGAIAFSRGLIAENHDAAIAHLQEAVTLQEQAAVPFERARSQLVLGERLRIARRRRDARDALEASLRTFEILGARPWADRAADALAALGAGPSSRSAPATRDLTAQELQIARAAASGLSNREIAAQLFLSVKTVEFHLRNAFRKLGVRSRTQLAARLLATDGAADLSTRP